MISESLPKMICQKNLSGMGSVISTESNCPEKIPVCIFFVDDGKPVQSLEIWIQIVP